MVFHWTPFFMLFSCWRKVDYANSRGFLAYSIHLEQEAATRFGQLADAMESCGNGEVEGYFAA